MSGKKKENMEDIIGTEVYEVVQKQFRIQSEILNEAFLLIFEAGLLDNMSMNAREYFSKNEHIQKAIMSGNLNSLEPRLTLKEYIQHITQLMDVPKHQIDFVSYIIRICYVMILAEKNPLVAQELRGVLNVNTALKEIIGG